MSNAPAQPVPGRLGAGGQPPAETNGFTAWFRQLRFMLKKNVLTLARNRRSTIIQVLVPLIMILFLFLVDIGLSNNKQNKAVSKANAFPDADSIGLLQECIKVDKIGNPLPPGSYTCTTLAYTPDNDPVVEDIVSRIRSQQGISNTRAFATPSAFNEYVFENRNSTQGAVHFSVTYSDPANPSLANLRGIGYAVQYNQTRQRYRTTFVEPTEQVLIPYVRAVNLAVLSLADELGPTPSGDVAFDFDLQEYPHPAIAPVDSVGQYGSVFFFGALMFNIVMQINQIVGERELHLRQSMHQMGLSHSVYWMSYAIVNFFVNLISGLLLIAFGAMFQFSFFTKTAFSVLIALFACFSIALVTLVFFLANFVSKARTGTILGFAMFLIGMLVQVATGAIFKDSTNIVIRLVFIIQPWALLSRAMDIIGVYASNEFLNGMSWDQRNTGFMSPGTVNNLLLIDAAIFLVVGLYLDNVLPDENGMSRSCFFCLKPSYWCPTGSRILGSVEPEENNKRARNDGADAEIALHNGDLGETDDDEGTADADVEEQIRRTKAGEDPDVVAEADRVRSTLDVNYPVRIDQLGKTYYAKTCCCIRTPEKDFQAVKEINLILDKNALFCLLGHNGAGKSTTISMMTGLLAPTSGDARVLGYSISTGMHEIKKHMGVCPQHDVLFNELTAAEHLELFASFKNLSSADIKREVEERLADVDLMRYRDTLAHTFSGGMKRRLSVAIALIGDPSIVYLDEPTTGMDHIAARQVWDLIERVKYDRVTVLTTHSMEEADILGDRIGIMKEGRLICLGSSIRLKNKFGTGYRVSVFIDGTQPSEVRRQRFKDITAFFKTNMPDAEIDGMEKSVLRFKVPRAATKKLVSFFSVLEGSAAQLGIVDIQTSLTTLEQVFMAVGSLGDDHADSRFGVSSQIGTELSKALARLAHIRDIIAQRQRNPAYQPPESSEAAVIDEDNSPEALAIELVQLEEIETVANVLERIKIGLEKNLYTPTNEGTSDQKAAWAASAARVAHLSAEYIGPATEMAHKINSNAAVALPPGPAPARVSPARAEHGVEMGNMGNDGLRRSDSGVFESVSAEMAMEQELVVKEFLKNRLLDKKGRCCGSFKKTWSKWSCCKKFGFIAIFVVIAIIVLIIVVSIVNRSTATEKFPALAVFTGAPALSALAAGEWSEIVPDAAATGATCVRGNPFSFFVYKPSDNANPTQNVLFQLGGHGSVCYNEPTCNSIASTVAYDITTDIDRASIRYQNLTGIWQKNDFNTASVPRGAVNPFENYLHIYVPLCTADAHWGDASVSYSPGETAQHRGGRNAKTALDWLITQGYVPADAPSGVDPTTSKVVVTGTGPGAWGAALWSAHLREAYSGVSHVFYLGDTDVSVVEVGTTMATLTPPFEYDGANLTTTTTAAIDFHNEVFGESTGTHAAVWGLDNSPALPTHVAGLTSPIDPATFTVESALGAISAHYGASGGFTVLRANSLTSARLTLEAGRSIIVDEPAVTAAPSTFVSMALQMASIPITMSVTSAQMSEFQTELEAMGFLTRAQRTRAQQYMVATMCAQIGERDTVLETAAGTASAQVGSVTTTSTTDSVLFSKAFFTAVSAADASETVLSWVTDSVSAGTPKSGVAPAAPCNAMLA